MANPGRSMVVELGRVVWLDAPRTGIQAEFHCEVGGNRVRDLVLMRKFHVGFRDYPRVEGQKPHDLGEFSGVIKRIVIPAKHDRPLTFCVDFDDNAVVQKALAWIRKCEPRNVLMFQTELEIDAEDEPDDSQTEFE